MRVVQTCPLLAGAYRESREGGGETNEGGRRGRTFVRNRHLSLSSLQKTIILGAGGGAKHPLSTPIPLQVTLLAKC